MDEFYDEDDELEMNDDELEDEYDDEIDEDEEGGDETDEDTDEEGPVEIVYRDADGNEVSEEFSEDELADMVSKYKNGELEEDPDYKDFQKIKPVFDHIAADNVGKNFLGYMREGYSGSKVIEGMFLQLHPELASVIEAHYSKPAEPEVDMSNWTWEQQQDYLIQKQVEAKLRSQLQPYEEARREVERIRAEKVYQEVQTHNMNTLAEALEELGWDVNAVSRDNTALAEIKKVIGILHKDAVSSKMNKDMAIQIIKGSIGMARKSSARKSTARGVAAQKKAPRIMGKTSAKAKGKPDLKFKDNLTMEARSKRIDQLLGF